MRCSLREAAAPSIAYALLGLSLIVLAQHYTPVIVAGGSMRPALIPGDLVVVARRLPPGQGDVALLRSGAGLVLHRVTRVSENGSVSTRGDANPVADFATTPRDRIRGRVVGVVPAGRVVQWWREAMPCGKLPAQTHSARR